MQKIENISELKKILKDYQKQGLSIGFVPTMGALHEGHLTLARRAKKENAISVMSIFVNPKQFGPNEDFSKYPRQLNQDEALASKERVDILFTPRTADMYPENFSTYIEEAEVSKVMCGAVRPGHFRGVCTVVFRLFQMVEPDRAYFGQKDAQQLRTIEKMVEDLRLNIQVVAVPTVRETDGLAMSSRNAYLSEEERTLAPQIYIALRKAQDAFQLGQRSTSRLIELVKEHLADYTRVQIQYAEVRRWRDFGDAEKIEEKSILAIATHLGTTRLIDNVILNP